jgi:hypothetical protein
VGFSADSAWARQTRFDHLVEWNLLHSRQKSTQNSLSANDQGTIQSLRYQTDWVGLFGSAQQEGQLAASLSRGEGVHAQRLNLSDSIAYQRGPTSLQLGFDGDIRLSEGDLNLDLNEQVERNRIISILENLSPNSFNANANRLYQQQVQGFVDASHQLTERLVVTASLRGNQDERRNNLANADLTQTNEFSRVSASARYQWSKRGTLSFEQARNRFVTSGQFLNETQQLEGFRLRQTENTQQARLDHQLSRTLRAGITYFRAESTTESLEPSTVEGPGLGISWQASRRDTLSFDLSRYQITIGERTFQGEFGDVNWQHQLAGDSEISLRLTKTYDSTQANFDALRQNQVLVNTRRNQIRQAELQSRQSWQHWQWEASWDYYEYETPQANPAFFEHRLRQEIRWTRTPTDTGIVGIQARRSTNRDTDALEELDLVGGYATFRRERPLSFNRQTTGYWEIGARHDWSWEHVQELRVERLGVQLALGLTF